MRGFVNSTYAAIFPRAVIIFGSEISAVIISIKIGVKLNFSQV
jgi:hypothetical protein